MIPAIDAVVNLWTHDIVQALPKHMATWYKHMGLGHPNVYLGCHAHAPKYWKPEFVHYLKTRGKDKVIFGTDWPVIDCARARREIAELGLSPEGERKLYRENVIRVYKLSDPVDVPTEK
ncbi:MAG: amidohydrolase family protein [Acidobacteria bacterium]|nr:amidohydrolase family protein [Acidobacteriota bacterium]